MNTLASTTIFKMCIRDRHCDCIAQYHGADMFSERFWALLERYVKMAADYGINLLYTPLFTPPLDTQIGGERLTCQLVEVTVEDGLYRFGFDRLSRWFAVARRCGITRFELSHFFTQWGAKCTPKIMASFGRNAFSYTHLDVYKRQSLDRSYICVTISSVPSRTGPPRLPPKRPQPLPHTPPRRYRGFGNRYTGYFRWR